MAARRGAVKVLVAALLCLGSSLAQQERVRCVTTKGTIEIDVTWAHSPRGVERCGFEANGY